MREEGHPLVALGMDTVMAGLKPVRKKLLPWATSKTLEIGCGTGANFPFYKSIGTLTAIEPDPHMRKRAQQKATAQGLPVQIVNASADELPFDDDSFDTIVATFVLCTIPDPEAAAREMARVLKPTGRLIFAEHVQADAELAQNIQRVATPVWSHVAGGCRLHNDAVTQLQDAGFSLQIQSKKPGRYHLFPVVYGMGKTGSFRHAQPF